jgi:hypothetical protein
MLLNLVLPMIVGKHNFGLSSPENPAFVKALPESIITD